MIFLDNYYYILFTIFLLILIYFVWQHFKIKKSIFTELELTITHYVLESATTNYKNSYFTQKYNQLLSRHDLDDSSATNSFKKFNREYEDLLKESAKDIYSNHLSDNIKKICLKYFTLDALLLQIISNLKD